MYSCRPRRAQARLRSPPKSGAAYRPPPWSQYFSAILAHCTLETTPCLTQPHAASRQRPAAYGIVTDRHRTPKNARSRIHAPEKRVGVPPHLPGSRQPRVAPTHARCTRSHSRGRPLTCLPPTRPTPPKTAQEGPLLSCACGSARAASKPRVIHQRHEGLGAVAARGHRHISVQWLPLPS